MMKRAFSPATRRAGPGRRARPALLALLAALPAPLFAQYGAPAPPPPPATPPRGEAQAPAAAATPTALPEVLRAAACVIGRGADASTTLLATAPFSPEERTQLGAFLRTAQRCLRQREPIVTQGFIARGAAAEALYEAQFATPAAARNPALGAAPLPRAGAALDAQTLEILIPMYGLVDCTTPRQPDLIRALLATEPRSPEEGAALSALNPAFVACVPAGTQLRIDPRIMRSFFAESLYRWSVVQRDGAASPWAAPPAAAPPPGQ